jgi:hypothetical protein
MAQETIGIKIQVEGGDAIKSVGSLKQQLREAQKDVTELSAKFGATSKEAVQAAQKAAELKDAIGDAKALTDAFNPDAKFRAFTSSLSAVAGGFGAVQGALGLVGVESDKVQETLLKVQSAMAISQGLQSIGEGIDSFKQLGAVIKNSTIFQKANNAVTVIATQVQKAFGVAVTGTGTAFKVLKGVIIATGIGALAIGIGLVVDKITSWTSGTDRAKEAQDRLNNALEEQNRLYEQQQKNLSQARTLALKQAEIANESADEIYKINTNYNNLELQAAKENQKKLQKQFADYRATIVATAKEFNADLTEQQIEQAGKDDEYYTNLKKQVEQSTEEIKNIEFKSQVDSLDNTIRVNKDKENANKKASDDARARAEKDAQAEIEYQNQLEELRRRNLQRSTDFANSLRDADIQKKKEKQDKELENEKIFIEKRDTLVQGSIDRNLDNIKKLQENSEERNDVLRELLFSQTEIELANLDNEFQKKFNIIKGNKEAELALEEQYEGLKKNLRMNALNQELGNYATAAGNIAQILGQTTAAGKAFAIAEATINTYKAASQVFAAPVPGVAPVSLGVKIATMVSALATGFKNVKSIIGTKTNGAVGSPNISTSNVSAPIAPAPTPQVQSTLLNAQAIQQLGNATSRAYVVESDVSSSQERIRRINRAARLG